MNSESAIRVLSLAGLLCLLASVPEARAGRLDNIRTAPRTTAGETHLDLGVVNSRVDEFKSVQTVAQAPTANILPARDAVDRSRFDKWRAGLPAWSFENRIAGVLMDSAGKAVDLSQISTIEIALYEYPDDEKPRYREVHKSDLKLSGPVTDRWRSKTEEKRAAGMFHIYIGKGSPREGAEGDVPCRYQNNTSNRDCKYDARNTPVAEISIDGEVLTPRFALGPYQHALQFPNQPEWIVRNAHFKLRLGRN